MTVIMIPNTLGDSNTQKIEYFKTLYLKMIKMIKIEVWMTNIFYYFSIPGENPK